MSPENESTVKETRAEYFPSSQITSQTNITSLTVSELKQLIREVVSQTLAEMLADPDEGLELREEIRETLLESVEMVQVGVNTQSAQDVAASLGLKW